MSVLTLTEKLAAWLETGGRRIGQVVIEPAAAGWVLRHEADELNQESLTPFSRPTDARDLALYDEAGAFRPLKSAPTLKRGWRVELATLAEVREALDYLYPAAVGNWFRHQSGEVAGVPLRETLNRQTGMYRITGLLNMELAGELICQNCAPAQCLRKIVWPVEPGGVPAPGLAAEKFDAGATRETMPVLCLEACNLVVAKGRPLVKKWLEEKEKEKAAQPE